MSNLLVKVFICGKVRKEHHPPHIGVSSITDRDKQSLNPAQVQPGTCELLALLLETYHIDHSRDIDELNTWKSSLDQQVTTEGNRGLYQPNKGKFRKK
ncbi:hypothetical protein COP2_003636 [Malus domestica]